MFNVNYYLFIFRKIINNSGKIYLKITLFQYDTSLVSLAYRYTLFIKVK